MDYRKLNDITISDTFPLPSSEDILDHLGKSEYLSSLDLASGFHQVLIHENDRQKTEFSTLYGHYEFNRMPFCLNNSITFQHLMNTILTGLNGIHCLIYLDDIIVFGKNLIDHNTKLIRNVFLCLKQNYLKLQPNKCFFLRKELNYL